MIKDSGDRTEYESGAVRDMKSDKGRCDLLPLSTVEQFLDLSLHYKGEDVLHQIEEFQLSGSSVFLFNAMSSFTRMFYDGSPAKAVLELSKHFQEGAEKYGEWNWQKGIPVWSFIDSAIRHYIKHVYIGETDEDHARAFMWNIVCAIWTTENRPELFERLDYDHGYVKNT